VREILGSVFYNLFYYNIVYFRLEIVVLNLTMVLSFWNVITVWYDGIKDGMEWFIL